LTAWLERAQVGFASKGMYKDGTYIKIGGVDSFDTSITPFVEVVLVPHGNGCQDKQIEERGVSEDQCHL
jgi:hypothetical protein